MVGSWRNITSPPSRGSFQPGHRALFSQELTIPSLPNNLPTRPVWITFAFSSIRIFPSPCGQGSSCSPGCVSGSLLLHSYDVQHASLDSMEVHLLSVRIHYRHDRDPRCLETRHAAGASLPGLRPLFRPKRAAEQSPSAPTYCRSRPTAADVCNLTKLVVNIQHLAPERDLAKGVSEPSTLPGGKVTARTGSRHIPTSGHTAEVPSLLATAGWATPCGRPAVRVSA